MRFLIPIPYPINNLVHPLCLLFFLRKRFGASPARPTHFPVDQTMSSVHIGAAEREWRSRKNWENDSFKKKKATEEMLEDLTDSDKFLDYSGRPDLRIHGTHRNKKTFTGSKAVSGSSFSPSCGSARGWEKLYRAPGLGINMQMAGGASRL